MLEFLKKHTRSPLGWVVLFLLVVALAYGVFVWSERVDAPGEDGSGEVEVVGEGIEVVEIDGKIIVRNEEAGYEVEVPLDWEVTSIDEQIILDGMDLEEKGSSGITGKGCKSTISNTNIVDLNLHFNFQCDLDEDCDSYKLDEYSSDIMAVTVEGSFMGSGTVEYYLRPVQKGKTYQRLTMLCSEGKIEKKIREDILSSFTRNFN